MKIQGPVQFQRRLQNLALAEHRPLRTMFELTYRCNFRCGHCYVPFRYRRSYVSRELTTKEIARVLEQLRDAGCFYLGLTGGEPFVRKDILKILRYARGLGFEVILYTNGSLIDRTTARALGQLRVNKVDITLPAVSEAVFRRVTGLPGAGQRVFEAVRHLRREGVPLGFKACILGSNRHEIPALREFAAALGCELRLDDTLSPRLDGSTAPYRYRARSVVRRQSSDVSQEPRARSQKTNDCSSIVHRPSSDSLFFCGAGRTQASITPAGELNLCGSIHFPKISLREFSFQEAWTEARAQLDRKLSGEVWDCPACRVRAYCDRCPALGWFHAGRFGACDPDSRRQAEGRCRDACHA